MRVVDKKVNYAGLLFADDPRYNNARAPAQSNRSEAKVNKFIQFKRANFLAAPHHAHLCSEHFSECDFANPMEYRMSKLTRCSGTLSKSWQSISFVFGARVGHFAATPQSDVVGIWSRDLGVMATLSVRQKMPFFRAFITLRSQFHLHHRSQRALSEIVSKITPNLGLVL